MTFGKINKIIKFVEKYIKKHELENLEKKDYYVTINEMLEEGMQYFPELSFKLLEEILSKKYDIKYTVTDGIKFDGGNNCFPDFKELYQPIEIPEEYKELEAHFQKLKALPQPEQRTKEWYDYRHNRITASDTAAAIDLNPYEPVENFILKKTDPNYAFLDNDNVYHGKKFEQVATQIYEHIYNAELTSLGFSVQLFPAQTFFLDFYEASFLNKLIYRLGLSSIIQKIQRKLKSLKNLQKI